MVSDGQVTEARLDIYEPPRFFEVLLRGRQYTEPPGHHRPDLGYESGIHLARDRPDIFARGLGLKKAGNHLMEMVGGRSVHPVNVRVGGFYRAPSARDLRGLIAELEQARQDALETVLDGEDVPDRPDGPVQPELRPAARRCRRRRAPPDSARPAPTRSAASPSARSNCCTRAARRSG